MSPIIHSCGRASITSFDASSVERVVSNTSMNFGAIHSLNILTATLLTSLPAVILETPTSFGFVSSAGKNRTGEVRGNRWRNLKLRIQLGEPKHGLPSRLIRQRKLVSWKSVWRKLLLPRRHL